MAKMISAVPARKPSATPRTGMGRGRAQVRHRRGAAQRCGVYHICARCSNVTTRYERQCQTEEMPSEGGAAGGRSDSAGTPARCSGDERAHVMYTEGKDPLIEVRPQSWQASESRKPARNALTPVRAGMVCAVGAATPAYNRPMDRRSNEPEMGRVGVGGGVATAHTCRPVQHCVRGIKWESSETPATVPP